MTLEGFLESCTINNPLVGRKLFPHRSMHKATRVSLDNVAVNEIYHLCISKRFRRSQHNVKVERGADVSSDHHRLIAKLKLKLKKI